MEKKHIFVKAIQENEKLIYKVATFYVDNKTDREDLVQEIIFNLWKSFDSFSNKSSLSTWIYRVAMNVAIVHLKKGKSKIKTIPIEVDIHNHYESTHDDLEEKLQKMQKHIKDLNLLDKGILMLYFENKSHEEIAEIVGISKSNVGTKLSRIKERLRSQISK